MLMKKYFTLIVKITRKQCYFTRWLVTFSGWRQRHGVRSRDRGDERYQSLHVMERTEPEEQQTADRKFSVVTGWCGMGGLENGNRPDDLVA